MPGDYNPYSGYVGGQLLMQGMNNFGQGIAEGMQNYQQNKQKSAMAEGQIEPYLKGLIASKDSLDPEFGKVVDRYVNAKASLADKMQLVGHIQTLQAQKMQDAENQQRQLAIQRLSQENQMGAIQLQNAQRFQQYLNNAMGQSNGQPTPAPQSQPVSASSSAQFAPQSVQPSMPIDNPSGFTPDLNADLGAFQKRTFMASGGKMPEASEINSFMAERNKWLNTEQQVGYAPLGHEYDDQGNSTGRKVVPVSMKPGQPGRMIVGDKPITIDPQNPVSIPLIDPATGKPLDANTAFGKNYNPNAKGAQEELQSTYSGLQKAMNGISNAKFFSDAVDAFAADPSSGNRLNALLGTERGAALAQLFTGRNPVEQLQAAQGKMYATMIDNLRNEKTGANGIRSITQQELANLQSQYGQPNMPPYIQKSLAANTVALANRHYDMMKAYADMRTQGMRPSDADAAVLKDPRFSSPIVQLAAAPTMPDKIPAPYIARLKSSGGAPDFKAAFDKRFGVGSADYIMGQK